MVSGYLWEPGSIQQSMQHGGEPLSERNEGDGSTDVAERRRGKWGFRALETAQCNQLPEQRKFPHMNTCRRWIEIYQTGGHVRPRIAAGNKFSKREIHGQDLINCAFYRHIYPKAYIDAVMAYAHNRNPTEAPYSISQVHRAEVRLGLWLKVGSSTADEAYCPINLSKRRQYGNVGFAHDV